LSRKSNGGKKKNFIQINKDRVKKDGPKANMSFYPDEVQNPTDSSILNLNNGKVDKYQSRVMNNDDLSGIRRGQSSLLDNPVVASFS